MVSGRDTGVPAQRKPSDGETRLDITAGVDCPTCGQFAKIYRRALNSGMAQALIKLYRNAAGEQFVHAPSIVAIVGGDLAKLAHWGLLEEQLTVRPDGGRAGYWRLTPKGRLFVNNLATVPKYVRIYNAEFLGHAGPEINIIDALGHKFDYRELMSQ